MTKKEGAYTPSFLCFDKQATIIYTDNSTAYFSVKVRGGI